MRNAHALVRVHPVEVLKLVLAANVRLTRARMTSAAKRPRLANVLDKALVKAVRLRWAAMPQRVVALD